MARLTWVVIAVTDPVDACKGGLPGTYSKPAPPKLEPPPKTMFAIFSYYTDSIFSRIYAVNVNDPGVLGPGVA